MFVPEMTLQEIKKEMFADLPAITNKVIAESAKGMKYVRKTNTSYLYRTYDYISPRNNPWIYGYTCRGYTNDKTTIHTMALIYQHNGYTALHYAINENLLLYHTAHFFKRYDERLGLGLVNPRDKIRHFIQHGAEAPYEKLQDIKPGVFSFFALDKMGVVLGTHYEDLRVVKFNTFLTMDMLKGKQKEMAESLKEHSVKYNNKHETEE